MAKKKFSLINVLIVAVLAVALLEVLALPVLSRVDGHKITRDELVESLHAPGGAKGGAKLPAPGEADRPEWMLGHVLHPYLGFVRNRDAAEQIFNGRPVDVPVNRFGFFGAPLPEERSEDRAVVALAGGSAALDLYLRSGPRLRAELERSRRFPGKRVEIVSLALGGMKEPQQLLALTWFLSIGRRPDVLVNFDGFNEIALPFSENTPFGVALSFPRSWRTYAATGFDPETAGLFARMQKKRERIAKWRRRLSSSPFRRSAAVLAFWKAWNDREVAGAARLEEEIRARLREGRGGDRLTFQESGPPGAPRAPAEVFRRSADVWAESSRQLEALCRANGIEYHHFLQPNQHLPGTKELTDWERRNAVAAPDYPHVRAVREGYPLLQKAGRGLAERDGVPFVDLTSIFRDEKGDIYADRCCHYNQAGNDILARAIAREIAATP